MKHVVFLMILAGATLTSNAYAGSFEDGLALYGAGKFSEAEQAWIPAAESGDSSAQYYLGQMYYQGKGVKKDLSRAYAWLSLASRGGNELATELRDDLAQEMNESQIAKAQQMVGALSR